MKKSKLKVNEKRLSVRVGKELKKLRATSELTQKSLALLIDTHSTAITRAEGGKYLPSLRWLQKIAWNTRHKLVIKFEKNK